jgi:hypothetical protein
VHCGGSLLSQLNGVVHRLHRRSDQSTNLVRLESQSVNPPAIRSVSIYRSYPTFSRMSHVSWPARLLLAGFRTRRQIVDQDRGYFPDKWRQPNFVDCIRSRKSPKADIEICHSSACLVQLGNVAYRTGNRLLAFDGNTKQFLDSAANAYLKPAYRKQFRITENVFE